MTTEMTFYTLYKNSKNLTYLFSYQCCTSTALAFTVFGKSNKTVHKASYFRLWHKIIRTKKCVPLEVLFFLRSSLFAMIIGETQLIKHLLKKKNVKNQKTKNQI